MQLHTLRPNIATDTAQQQESHRRNCICGFHFHAWPGLILHSPAHEGATAPLSRRTQRALRARHQSTGGGVGGGLVLRHIFATWTVMDSFVYTEFFRCSRSTSMVFKTAALPPALCEGAAALPPLLAGGRANRRQESAFLVVLPRPRTVAARAPPAPSFPGGNGGFGVDFGGG